MALVSSTEIDGPLAALKISFDLFNRAQVWHMPDRLVKSACKENLFWGS